MSTTLHGTVPLPVTCPACGKESLIDFPALVLQVALTRWNQLALYVHCHPHRWDATPDELERIRRYLGPSWLDALLGASAAPPTVPPVRARPRRHRAV